jgi:hypothetical protein
MVGLTFSCDGAHYLPAEEFLARDEGFWLGGSVLQAAYYNPDVWPAPNRA